MVEAYRTACDHYGANTEDAGDCATCDEGRKENSQWNVRGNQNKVDIVVVVSETEELARRHPSPADKIRVLMQAIGQKLQQFNGQDVRAALVGVDGAGVHQDAHTHTINK